jgi:nucleoside 2-deoxyribosyltransferase
MRTVYLAGPITAKTIKEANDWRDDVVRKLEQSGIRGISPLRCEPPRGDRYSLSDADPRFGTARAIGSKNVMDVQMCDMTLAYLPKFLNEPWPSLGTISELSWAHIIGKPTILVSDDERITHHPVIDANSGWIVPTLDDAVAVIVGVFGDYVRPVQTFDWPALQTVRRASV